MIIYKNDGGVSVSALSDSGDGNVIVTVLTKTGKSSRYITLSLSPEDMGNLGTALQEYGKSSQ